MQNMYSLTLLSRHIPLQVHLVRLPGWWVNRSDIARGAILLNIELAPFLEEEEEDYRVDCVACYCHSHSYCS